MRDGPEYAGDIPEHVRDEPEHAGDKNERLDEGFGAVEDAEHQVTYQQWKIMMPSAFEDMDPSAMRGLKMQHINAEIRRLGFHSYKEMLSPTAGPRTSGKTAIRQYICSRHEKGVSCNRLEPLLATPTYQGTKERLVQIFKGLFPFEYDIIKTSKTKPVLYEKFREIGLRGRRKPLQDCLPMIYESGLVIVLCTRWSSGATAARRGTAALLQKEIIDVLKKEEIVQGAKDASFFHSYRRVPLSARLPTVGDNVHACHISITNPLTDAPPNTQVLLGSIGIEAISSDEGGLKKFYQCWIEHRHLKVTILIAETALQWHSKNPPWQDESLWKGPFLERYWAALVFDNLIEAIDGGGSDFAKEYLEQLRVCAEGRKRSDEGRLEVGRNALGP